MACHLLYLRQGLGWGKGAIKASTSDSYESVLCMHLLPFFDPMELAKIRLEDVQRYVATKQQEGPLKPKTINNTLVSLKEMFTQACAGVTYARIPLSLCRETPRASS
jgi:Phage integrase, N-terminal SAM-like domain